MTLKTPVDAKAIIDELLLVQDDLASLERTVRDLVMKRIPWFKAKVDKLIIMTKDLTRNEKEV